MAPQAQPDTYADMRGKGFHLGTGISASLGWFDVSGVDREGRRIASSTLVRSCTEEERAFVHRHGRALNFTTYDVREHSGDRLLALVEIGDTLM